jgi:hypothetical protein
METSAQYSSRMIRSIAHAVLLIALAMAAHAHTGDCNAPAASPSVTISLPASPFMVAPSKDGCWVFVSLTADGKVERAIAQPMQ